MKPIVVIGFLGTTLDQGKTADRWQRWRPTVSLCQQPDLAVDRLELIHAERHRPLAHVVAADVVQVSPETRVNHHHIDFKDPWDFEEVYAALHAFARVYPFDPDTETYLVHMTTGTHVAQICWFLLVEAHVIPGKLLQATPPKRWRDSTPGTHGLIDLDLSRYDKIATRFKTEQAEATSFLKSGIATRNAAFNRMIDDIEQVAIRARTPMLLTGPTGAGKSQLARRIYDLKKSRHQIKGPFVEVNCATLRGDAAMSALFGHVNGHWLETAEIPSDRAAWGPFVTLADAAEEHAREIIEEAAAGSLDAVDAGKIGDLYTSFMDEARVEELGHTPIVGGLTRMVLISDGQANDGIYDRGDLAQLVANTAARGMSISTVGVGDDFDEVTMQQLAQVGRGNYYYVANTANLGAMFDRELAGLTETVAANVELVLTPTSGVEIVEVYGYQLARHGLATVVPVADLRAGETRKIVLRTRVSTTALGPLVASRVDLTWRRVVDGQARRAATAAVVDVVPNDGAGGSAVAASVDPTASLAAEQAHTAHALDEATTIYEREGYDAARRVLDQRMQAMHANRALAPADAQKLDTVYGEAIGTFSRAPAASNPGATKATRETAYHLAR